MSEPLWTNERIGVNSSEATDELDGGPYMYHAISQLLVKMRGDYEAQLANQYQRIERFVELVDSLERELEFRERVVLKQHDYIKELEARKGLNAPTEVTDTIRRSVIASESLNSTDAWYKRMTTALTWLDQQEPTP